LGRLVTPEVRAALAIDRSSTPAQRTVDITTTGARSGLPRRIETWFYRFEGQIYLTGMPGKRDWHRNLLANPAFTFHLKHGVSADLAAIAIPVTDPEERRRVLTEAVDDLNARREPNSDQPLRTAESWIEGSPLVRVEFAD
jgi:hypothetical protein